LITILQNGATGSFSQTIGSEIDMSNFGVAANQCPGLYYCAASATFAFTFNTAAGSNTGGIYTGVIVIERLA
jgi:hypothetical protein